MPQCKNSFLFDEEKLENAINFFENRRSLVHFLLNVILNIQEIWLKFCKCDGVNICLPCQVNICYRKCQYVVYDGCLNLDFLLKVKDNLHTNLLKMVTTYNHFLCEIINKKYQYLHKDWFTGEDVQYDLGFCLTNFEQKLIKSIKETNFKIVL